MKKRTGTMRCKLVLRPHPGHLAPRQVVRTPSASTRASPRSRHGEWTRDRHRDGLRGRQTASPSQCCCIPVLAALDKAVHSTLASQLLLVQRLVEVELQPRLRPLHDTELAAVRQSDVGCAHIWTAETNVGRVAVRHFHGANDLSGRRDLGDIAGVQGRNCDYCRWP